MIRLGLLGKSIQHSRSKFIYEELLHKKIHYNLYDFSSVLEIPNLDFFAQNNDGISITSPYKEHFINSVILSKEAEVIGAINCIKFEDSKFCGFNTDYFACEELIHKYNLYNEAALVIFGNGPMARMILFLLKNYKGEIHHLYRTSNFQINDFNFNCIHSNDFSIINCCSRGVVFNHNFNHKKLNKFWDLNYGQDGLFSHIPHNAFINGLELLKLQAKFALKIWGIK